MDILNIWKGISEGGNDKAMLIGKLNTILYRRVKQKQINSILLIVPCPLRRQKWLRQMNMSLLSIQKENEGLAHE